VRRALEIAEERGRFRVAEVSPRAAAARIRVPVLLIHGERDTDTPPSHSRAIFAAPGGPKELVIVPGAGHDDTLASADVWARIDRWLARVAPVRGHRAFDSFRNESTDRHLRRSLCSRSSCGAGGGRG
jgi:pimeloyl-ACP methyl ester carboxylesterase